MPLYTYRCPKGHTDRRFAKIVGRDGHQDCNQCEASMLRVFEAPAVRPEITPYQSPVDGSWIDSRAARREDLKKNGCIEWDPGIRQDLPKIKEANFEKLMAPVEAAIDDTARALVASGQLSSL